MTPSPNPVSDPALTPAAGTKRGLRILQVSAGGLPAVPSRFGGAIQRRVWALARELRDRGHHVEVVSPNDITGRVLREGVLCHYVRFRNETPVRLRLSQLRLLAAARRIATKGEFDVVHHHSQFLGGWLHRRTPAVLSYDYHSLQPWRPVRELQKGGLGRFSMLLPCSDYCAGASTADWHLTKPPPVRVVHNGVDVRLFSPKQAAAPHPAIADLDGQVVLFVGRVCEQKGADTFLEGALHAAEAGKDWAFVMAGPLEQFDYGGADHWSRRISASRVRYLGPVADEELPDLYRSADVVVMPTRRLEMFGMVAIEAQASGVPVVASRHGGLLESVANPEVHLFQPGDAEDMVRAVDRVLRQQDPERDAKEAREHALTFSWGAVVDDLEDVYATVVPDRRPTGRHRR